jgi:ribulose-5-phosphate 4-epimerase/fuculose-1-phosphate aldolase
LGNGACGLLTAAPSIADAFVAMYVFEDSCMIQLRAQSGGSELVPIPKTVLDGMQTALNKATRGSSPGALAWPALLRKLDRLDPSFRE